MFESNSTFITLCNLKLPTVYEALSVCEWEAKNRRVKKEVHNSELKFEILVPCKICFVWPVNPEQETSIRARFFKHLKRVERPNAKVIRNNILSLQQTPRILASSLPPPPPSHCAHSSPSKKIFYINQVMQDCNELLAGRGRPARGAIGRAADCLSGTAPSFFDFITQHNCQMGLAANSARRRQCSVPSRRGGECAD